MSKASKGSVGLRQAVLLTGSAVFVAVTVHTLVKRLRKKRWHVYKAGQWVQAPTCGICFQQPRAFGGLSTDLFRVSAEKQASTCATHLYCAACISQLLSLSPTYPVACPGCVVDTVSRSHSHRQTSAQPSSQETWILPASVNFLSQLGVVSNATSQQYLYRCTPPLFRSACPSCGRHCLVDQTRADRLMTCSRVECSQSLPVFGSLSRYPLHLRPRLVGYRLRQAVVYVWNGFRNIVWPEIGDMFFLDVLAVDDWVVPKSNQRSLLNFVNAMTMASGGWITVALSSSLLNKTKISPYLTDPLSFSCCVAVTTLLYSRRRRLVSGQRYRIQCRKWMARIPELQAPRPPKLRLACPAYCRLCQAVWPTPHSCRDTTVEHASSQKLLQKLTVSCPNCAVPTVHFRGEGCHHVVCPRCRHHWCYCCKRPWATCCAQSCGAGVLCDARCTICPVLTDQASPA